MKLKIPADVEKILKVLSDGGYEGFAVGGCVRDSVLGREPSDWDITTSAKPEQVKELFGRTVDTGLQHGTVTVMIGREGYEVTTYRIDGEYLDGRHPKDVVFTASLEEDLKRRDFTINAMAYHPDRGLVDLFGGMEDLRDGVVRCVGDPLDRFTEDALRIMRAVRFSAQLGFTIEENTFRALHVLAPNLRQVSAERIQAEMVKLVTSPHPDHLRIAWEAGVTKVFFPEFDEMMETAQNHPHHQYTVGEHALHSMLYVPEDKVLRLAMLFHDIGKIRTKTTDEQGIDHFFRHGEQSEILARAILRRWKFDNDTIAKVKSLCLYHDGMPSATARSVRKAVNRIGKDLFPLYLQVQRADILAQSDYEQEEKLRRLQQVEELYESILREKQCVTIQELAVTGSDLIRAGIPAGPEMGRILHFLLEQVLEDPARNTPESLLNLALGYKKSS